MMMMMKKAKEGHHQGLLPGQDQGGNLLGASPRAPQCSYLAADDHARRYRSQLPGILLLRRDLYDGRVMAGLIGTGRVSRISNCHSGFQGPVDWTKILVASEDTKMEKERKEETVDK